MRSASAYAVACGALLLAGAVVPAWADPLVLRLGRLGEVQTEESGPTQPPLPGNVASSTTVISKRFVRLGTDIAGVYCKQFGLEYRAANLPPGTVAPVTVQLQHPLWTLPDGRTSTVETHVSDVSADHWSYSGYMLEEPWSLVPGPWTYTISQGPRVLAVATFNLTVEPSQHAPPDGGCDALTS